MLFNFLTRVDWLRPRIFAIFRVVLWVFRMAFRILYSVWSRIAFKPALEKEGRDPVASSRMVSTRVIVSSPELMSIL